MSGWYVSDVTSGVCYPSACYAVLRSPHPAFIAEPLTVCGSRTGLGYQGSIGGGYFCRSSFCRVIVPSLRPIGLLFQAACPERS